MLGKLHISPASSEEKLRDLYAEVSAAVDEGLLSDATSRNALYKLHVSLGKIVNTLDEQQSLVRGNSRSMSINIELQPTEEKVTIKDDMKIKEEDENEGDTLIPLGAKDALVDDDLSSESQVVKMQDN